MLNIKALLMQEIGFLRWARLSDEDAQAVGCAWVFISPDVNSLHLVWQCGEWIQHEIANYPHDPDYLITDFLDDEVGMDAWETWEYPRDPYEMISDFRDESPATVPIISVAELGEKQG